MVAGHTLRRVTDRPVRNYYTHPGDASKYLNQSLVRYNGEPCFILIDVFITPDGAPKHKAFLYKDQTFNASQRLAIVDLDDPELDISSPPIGYANVVIDTKTGQKRLRVFYCQRQPYQMWKQGLTHQNVQCLGIDGSVTHMNVIGTPGFMDSVRGIFPDFEGAVATLLDESSPIKEIAVNLNIALQKRDSGIITAFHKTREFGHIPIVSIEKGKPFIETSNDLVGWAIKKNNPEVDIRIVGREIKRG